MRRISRSVARLAAVVTVLDTQDIEDLSPLRASPVSEGRGLDVDE